MTIISSLQNLLFQERKEGVSHYRTTEIFSPKDMCSKRGLTLWNHVLTWVNNSIINHCEQVVSLKQKQ